MQKTKRMRGKNCPLMDRMKSLFAREIESNFDAIHREELLDVRVIRFLQLRRRAEEDHAAFVQEDDPVGDLASGRRSCVTTTDVSCSWFFSRSIRSPRWSDMIGSTMVVGSSYRMHCGWAASARAMATARL